MSFLRALGHSAGLAGKAEGGVTISQELAVVVTVVAVSPPVAVQEHGNTVSKDVVRAVVTVDVSEADTETVSIVFS